ncbi:phospholipid-transporting ATPase VD-like isoform X2 [Tubulanus polymorphus]|uniref:phospholipid-transporting ATPase VD-like isoform X2 n=1 Tax=Tubulanus polymorphus TaxID=672921 RepID=UPI003DA6066B
MGNIIKRAVKKQKDVPAETRTIFSNYCTFEGMAPAEHLNRTYANNLIKTTKYNVWTFLPKNLFEQFHRFANVYFLFLIVLNWIPELSVFMKEVSMLPLLFVLSVTGVKDAYEDFRRYQSDKKVNNMKSRVFFKSSGRYESTKWKDICAGDIVHVTCNETIPADILVLHSSDTSGICYIETANIDGENNLKQREVIPGMQHKHVLNPLEFRSVIEVEVPNTRIYHFNGSITSRNGSQVALSKTNLILRGCVLRNTDYVEGIVIYAGHETKSLLNNHGPRFKRSKLERRINKDVMWCVAILAILCFSGAIGYAVWLSGYKNAENVVFLPFESLDQAKPVYQAFISFWIFIILLQAIIPLPLYVTIEICKMIQIIWIHFDMDLYYPESDTRIECRALNIAEDLGQIQYLFSDKTGTLTENRMTFRCCNIGGIEYTAFPDDKDKSYDNENDSSDLDHQLENEISKMSSMKLGTEELTRRHQQIQDFFLLMAVCNTVVVAAKPHGEEYAEEEGIPVQTHEISDIEDTTADTDLNIDQRQKKKHHKKHHRRHRNHRNIDIEPTTKTSSHETLISPKAENKAGNNLTEAHYREARHCGSKLKRKRKDKNISEHDCGPVEITLCYEAESPDELALVKAAYRYGCRLLRRGVNSVTVWFPSEGEVTFKVLKVLPFDAERKRMSVVIQYPNCENVIVYTKGADSSILSNLADVSGNLEEEALIKQTELSIELSANQGLRTLCMAKKTLTLLEYEAWLNMYEQADLMTYDRKDKALFHAVCQLETDLELLGASGIEDNLQEGVPETITSLRKAGINIWMLTGDKQETAINIGYSCKLIDPQDHIIKLNATKKDEAERLIEEKLEWLQKTNRQIEVRQGYRRPAVRKDIVLVIDGITLGFALDEESKLDRRFLSVAEQCYSVICCRATPLQKASVVSLVKANLRMTTLAIGDGANDVNMIHTADIGVGISGPEGMQAVMASDFSIGRFRHLEKLLLVHGHWCYDRLARMCLYMFYKNTLYALAMYWFQLVSGFSAYSNFNQFYQVFYNLFFTSAPPVVFGGLDQTVSAITLLTRPQLYKDSQNSRSYLSFSYWVNVIDATYQSLMIFYLPYFTYKDSEIGIWQLGMIHISLCVIMATFHLAIETKSWTLLYTFFISVNFINFYGFSAVFAAAITTSDHPSNPYWVFYVTYSSPTFWFTLLITVVVALLPRMTIRALKATLYPSMTTFARQVELLDPSMGSQWFQKSTATMPNESAVSFSNRPLSKTTLSKRRQSMTMAVMRHISRSMPSFNLQQRDIHSSTHHHHHNPTFFQASFISPSSSIDNSPHKTTMNSSRHWKGHRRYPSMPPDITSLSSHVKPGEDLKNDNVIHLKCNDEHNKGEMLHTESLPPHKLSHKPSDISSDKANDDIAVVDLHDDYQCVTELSLVCADLACVSSSDLPSMDISQTYHRSNDGDSMSKTEFELHQIRSKLREDSVAGSEIDSRYATPDNLIESHRSSRNNLIDMSYYNQYDDNRPTDIDI